MALNLDAIDKKIGPLRKDYEWKDVVLYALGVGAGFKELEYCFEQRLKVVPTFSIAAVYDFLVQAAINSQADLSGILHGEQEIIFHQPFPVQGVLTTEGAVTHIYDKGTEKGALVVAEADTYHSDVGKLFTNIFTLFCRKDGGFEGIPAPDTKVKFPDRPPDFDRRDRPAPDQPLLYRLSGDVFALHVDPEYAQASGFEKPIMAGLCTFGYACRALIHELFPGQPERMTRIRVRFSGPLYPGVAIDTSIWKTGDGQALFRVCEADSGEVVLTNGTVEWQA